MDAWDSDAGLWARFAWLNEQLRANRYPRPSQLARAFEVSIDTARRTIERFERHLGAPIAYDPSRKGYYYPEGCRAVELPPLWLADPGSSMVLSGLALMGHGIRKGSDLTDHLGALLPGKYGRLAERIMVETTGHHPPRLDVFVQVIEALASERSVILRYAAKTHDEPTERTLDPLILQNINGNWYLYAHCQQRKDRRLFALDRIDAVLGLGATFDHAAHVAHGDPRKELSGTFGVYKRTDREWATIRFYPPTARWIRDESWHPEQEIVDLPDGSLELRLPFGADGLDVLRAVLQYGPDAEVIAPPHLRATASKRLAAALHHYGDTTAPIPG